MKRYRFILFGKEGEFWAYNFPLNFAQRWRKSYPQFKNLTTKDFKNITIV